jgi:aminoglycoside phosphotransferase (APT) family kinase protein
VSAGDINPADDTRNAEAARRFERWMAEQLDIQDARLAARLGGGNSNVTQLVESRQGSFIIRRPPDNAISASAARGVQREHRMLKALQGRARVPMVHGFCDDATVLGQPFIIMEHVAGTAISTSLPAAYADDAQTLRQVGHELVDAIAQVHRLDWRELGMRPPDPARDYISREIERWREVRAADQVRDLPLFEELGGWLADRKPARTTSTIIHGDYHLDNTLFRLDTPVLAAVIDWELCTVGDPLADLALMLMFWGPRTVEPPGFAFVQAVTRRHDVIAREALAARWSAATGIAIDDLDYYLCFAFWRLAAIVEGAYALFQKGLVADAYSRKLEYDVPALLTEAAQRVGLR